MSPLIKKILILVVVIGAIAFTALSTSENHTESFVEQIAATQQKSWVGQYLSGYHAMQNNQYQKASDYFSSSIKRNDNPHLKSKTLTLLLVSGNYDEAFKVAENVKELEESTIAGLALIVKETEKGNFKKAAKIGEDIKKLGQDSIIHKLALAWAKIGENNKLPAQKIMNDLMKQKSLEPLVSYQYALMSDIIGDTKKADQLYTNLLKRNKLPNGIAAAAYRFFEKEGMDAKKEKVSSKVQDKEKFLRYQRIDTPKKGMAESFLSVAGIIMTEYRSDKAAAFFRLAIYLNPQMDEAKMLLGSILVNEEDYEGANTILKEIGEASYLWDYAQLAVARNYKMMEQPEKSIQVYKKLLTSKDARVDALVSLGDLERNEEDYAQAMQYYTQALETINSKKEGDSLYVARFWSVYFARGVTYERQDKWEEAEADFKKALELNPNQPDVLNYLGYSWIDKGINLDKAKKMILEAHKQRPQDAHITDSVGWAYYRLGEYDEAVYYLEKAASMMPYDSTVNDHLGDTYWALGRENEAYFQWQRALENDPEEEEIEKIEAKINRENISVASDNKVELEETPQEPVKN